MLNHIRIVLIETSHPGNIGATARAMKTMGLTQLYLVQPNSFPHQKATEMAASADDVLQNSVVVSTLDEAVADCHLIVGASARERTIPWPLVSPRELGEKIHTQFSTHQTAILFGREHSGLTNEELQRCQFHVHIPSHPAYSSLNLAAAVQVIAYELRVATLTDTSQRKWDYPSATHQAIEAFYAHLQTVLVDLDFLNPKAPRQLMTRLRRLFARAELDTMEVNILRGILGAIDKKIASK